MVLRPEPQHSISQPARSAACPPQRRSTLAECPHHLARPPRWEGWSENVSPGTPRPRWTAARSLAQLRIQEESAPLAPVKPCDSGRLGAPAPSVTPRRAQPTEERASTSLQTAVVPARPGSRQATRTHARFRLRHCPKPQPAGCPMSPRPSQSRPCRGQDLLVLTQVKIGRAEPSPTAGEQPLDSARGRDGGSMHASYPDASGQERAPGGTGSMPAAPCPAERHGTTSAGPRPRRRKACTLPGCEAAARAQGRTRNSGSGPMPHGLRRSAAARLPQASARRRRRGGGGAGGAYRRAVLVHAPALAPCAHAAVLCRHCTSLSARHSPLKQVTAPPPPLSAWLRDYTRVGFLGPRGPRLVLTHEHLF